MPHCKSCNKFVAQEENDPEVNNLEVDNEGAVNAEVRIVNTCAECEEELTESIFNVDDQISMPEDVSLGHEHDLEVEEISCERTRPDHTPPRKDGKPTNPRSKKTYYGFELIVKVTCNGCNLEEDLTLADDVQASSMEALN